MKIFKRLCRKMFAWARLRELSELELVQLEGDYNEVILNLERISRDPTQKCFDRQQAEYLLQKQNKIPPEWRDCIVLFPQEIVRQPVQGVLCICWDKMGEIWFLDYSFYKVNRLKDWRLIKDK